MHIDICVHMCIYIYIYIYSCANPVKIHQIQPISVLLRIDEQPLHKAAPVWSNLIRYGPQASSTLH